MDIPKIGINLKHLFNILNVFKAKLPCQADIRNPLRYAALHRITAYCFSQLKQGTYLIRLN